MRYESDMNEVKDNVNEGLEKEGIKKRDALAFRECHIHTQTHEGNARKPIHICHQNASGFAHVHTNIGLSTKQGIKYAKNFL